VISAQAARFKHQFHGYQNGVATGNGHRGQHMGHHAITISVAPQATLEQTESFG
jgi:hypothetical protein